jgi:hypothetical protein
MSTPHTYSLFDLTSEQRNTQKIAARAVETYPLEWIVTHETLQNSLDAIQKSGRTNGGRIDIELDLDERRVTIKDNGRGFPHDISLLGLGGTDKDDDPDSSKLGGNLGMGLKVVILSSESFELRSVVNKKLWRVEVHNGHLFSQGADVRLEVFDEVDEDSDNNTEIIYRFPEEQVSEFVELLFDRYFDKIQDELARDDIAKFKTAVQYHFRTHSYAGNVSRLLNVADIVPVDIHLRICSQNAQSNTGLSNRLKELLVDNNVIDIEFHNKHWDIAEVIQGVPRRVRKPFLITDPQIPPGGRFQKYPKNHILIKNFRTAQEYSSLLENPYLRTPIDIAKYQRLFEQLEGIYLIIGSVDLVEKYLVERQRQFIAANGVPSFNSLQAPIGIGDLGYLANIHVVLNVKQKLNLGKQTISNTRLLNLCNQFFSDAFKATLRHVAKAFVGEPQLTTATDRIEQLQLPTNEILGRPDLGLPEFTLVKEPAVEAEVIALFYTLLGRGYLQGYRTYGLYHVGTYDGRGMMKLARMIDFPEPRSDSDLVNFEFKLKLSWLLDDFETGKKKAQDIALLIVWEDDDVRHPDYQVVDIGETPDRDRYMDQVDRCLVNREGRSIQVLVLKDVVERLKQSLT